MPTRPDAIYSWGAGLPRTDAVVVHGRRKLRVGSTVYLAFDVEETVMGFGYPKLEREALVASAPGTFQMPRASDLRFNWVVARLGALDPDEARELVLDAWATVVPRFLARQTRLTLDMVRHRD
ncbi:MAG: MmcQ/YjbR family DNA-binding protein [Demequinaceae bacterium]|nr:MmcQ/YjbR family DNA-binding protein [Demequinaceae bacterium]